MATKKFIIEMEEGVSVCHVCPFDDIDGRCDSLNDLLFGCTCKHINLATMKIKEYEED